MTEKLIDPEEPEVVEMYSRKKQTFFQRWLPVIIAGAIAVVVVIGFFVYQVFFIAPKVDEVRKSIPGFEEKVPLPTVPPELPIINLEKTVPVAQLPTVEVKKITPTEVPKVEVIESKKATPATPSVSAPAVTQPSDQGDDDDGWDDEDDDDE